MAARNQAEGVPIQGVFGGTRRQIMVYVDFAHNLERQGLSSARRKEKGRLAL